MNFWKRLGLGLGDMELLLPETNLMLGQTMDGELLFHLSEETVASAVYVGLRAYQDLRRPKLTNIHENGHSRVETQEENERISLFHARTRLDGEGTYCGGFYNFQVRMPHGLEDRTSPRSDFDRVLEFVGALRHGISVSRGPVIWELYGELDIPWSRSLKRVLRLNVYPGHPHQTSPYQGAPGVVCLPTPRCGGCGGPVSVVYGCANCGSNEPAQPKARFCGDCGQPRRTQGRYCGNCGQPYSS